MPVEELQFKPIVLKTSITTSGALAMLLIVLNVLNYTSVSWPVIVGIFLFGPISDIARVWFTVNQLRKYDPDIDKKLRTIKVKREGLTEMIEAIANIEGEMEIQDDSGKTDLVVQWIADGKWAVVHKDDPDTTLHESTLDGCMAYVKTQRDKES